MSKHLSHGDAVCSDAPVHTESMFAIPQDSGWRVQALTAPGAGAVSLIAWTGTPEVLAAAREICFPDWKGGWRMRTAVLAHDDVLVLPVSETCVWVCPHGGQANRQALLNWLAQRGAEVLVTQHVPEWPEASAPVEADLLCVLAMCPSPGIFKTLVQQPALWREAAAGEGHIEAIEAPHWLMSPSVVLAGCPNAGKSSLLNAMLGRNAVLTSEEAGTTRDWTEHRVVLPWLNGWSVRLIDTPGLRENAHMAEKAALALSESVWSEADLLIAVRAPDQPWPSLPRSPHLYVETHGDLTGCSGGRGDAEDPICVSSSEVDGWLPLVKAAARALGCGTLPSAPWLFSEFLRKWHKGGRDMSSLAWYLGAEHQKSI